MTNSYPAFEQFFEKVHGFTPHKWQKRLAEYVDKYGKIPDRIDVPTGLGKTATIDVAVWALGKQLFQGTTRTIGQRIVHIVERQIVVDGAFLHVKRLCEALKNAEVGGVKLVADALRMLELHSDIPLTVTSFHGSRKDTHNWLRLSGAQVIVATATQTTLRLLGHAPGVSRLSSSIHAGLLGIDSTLLFDEPHLAAPQVRTIKDVLLLQSQAKEGIDGVPASTLTLLGATLPPDLLQPVDSSVGFDPLDMSMKEAELWNAEKSMEVISSPTKKCDDVFIAQSADALENLWSAGIVDKKPRAAIIVNTVKLARDTYEILSKKFRKTDHKFKLLTSRTRPYDREAADQLFNAYDVLIATQTVEVGADFSVDALITEIAPWPVLTQRLGRLNRDNLSPYARATVIIPINDKGEIGSTATRFIYGSHAIDSCGRGLLDENKRCEAQGADSIPIGLKELASLRLRILDDQDEDVLWQTPERRASLTLEIMMLLMSTSTEDSVPPDLTAWLQGPDSLSQHDPVSVLWRRNYDSVRKSPPQPAEIVEIPVSEFHALLTGDVGNIDKDNDAGVPAPLSDPNLSDLKFQLVQDRLKQCLIRKGNKWEPIERLSDIYPGATVVLATELGGYSANTGLKVEKLKENRDDQARFIEVRDVSLATILMSKENLAWAAITKNSLSVALEAIAIKKEELLTDENLNRKLNKITSRISEILDNEELKLDEKRRIAGECLRVALRIEEKLWTHISGDNRVYIKRQYAKNSSDNIDSVTLLDHSAQVRELAVAGTKQSGLSQNLVDEVSRGAFLHDRGKAVEGFQRKLGYVGRDSDMEFYAKSQDGQDRRNDLSGLPEHYDHALVGARLAEAQGESPLVCHLIGSHHGGMRGVHRGWTITATWVDRFRSLTRRFGPWGLAWLEAAVRIADWQASAKPEAKGTRNDILLDSSSMDWLRVHYAEIGPLELADSAADIELSGLFAAPLTLNWYAAAGVLALANTVDPKARLHWQNRTPVLSTNAKIGELLSGFGDYWKEIIDEINAKLAEANSRYTVVEEKNADKKLTVPKIGVKNQRLAIAAQAIEWLNQAEWSSATKPIAQALWLPFLGRVSRDKALLAVDNPNTGDTDDLNRRHVEPAGLFGRYELPVPLLPRNSSVFNWPIEFEPESVWDPSLGYTDATAMRGSGGLDSPNEGTSEMARETISRAALVPLALFGSLSLGPGLEPAGRGTDSSYIRTGGSIRGNVKRRFIELPISNFPVTIAGLSDILQHTASLADGEMITSKYGFRSGEDMPSVSGSQVILLPRNV